MKIIHKYPIQIIDNQVISTLVGKIVHVGLDPTMKPCVWVEGNTDFVASRRLVIIGTGREMPPEQIVHIGSFVDGHYVWHVYEGISNGE